MATTVLVTGGFGFIGSHTVRRLRQSGFRVVVIARRIEGNSADDVLDPDERRAIEVVATEIPPAGELATLLRRQEVELIVHLASPLSVRTEGDPGLAVTDMVVPQLAILDAARDAGVHKVVWASSVGVFGRTSDYPGLPIPNDAPHYPLTIYGAAKSFLERLSREYTQAHGLQTIGLRFPLVYGPGRRRGGGQFTTRMIEGAALGQGIVAEGTDARHDWMYVADAARSVELALAAAPGRSLALTVGGEVATVGQVADILSELLPDAPRRDTPGTSELVADYDVARALDEIGYAPGTSLRAGVLETFNAARRRAGLQLVA